MGRDFNKIDVQCSILVSIHAPTWGATRSVEDLKTSARFQSTRPRGARRISINSTPTVRKFQSTRPRGARLWTSCWVVSPDTFQSTRPRGARRQEATSSFRPYRFQSTRPRGARRHALPLHPHQYVSIHAPTWGATSSQDKKLDTHLFQSTRPRGARRRCPGRSRCAAGSFNPRAHVGRDTPTIISSTHNNSFNPRAHVGRDLVLHTHQ